MFSRSPTGWSGLADDPPRPVQERQRVMGENPVKDIISIRGLRKVYAALQGQPPKVAVRDLWFGVREGECFGERHADAAHRS